METEPARCLINSISRFIHLVSCQTLKLIPTHRGFETTAVLMKQLKPFLDEIIDEKISPDETLLKECEQLDIDINEARECLERGSLEASKILSVWQSELAESKIRGSSLEICRILCRLLRASPSSSTLAGVQVCRDLMKFIQELQNWQPNRISRHFEQALRDQSDNSVSQAEDFAEIIEFLGLTSNQELLKERISIEKERMEAQSNGNKEEANQIYQATDLISHIRDYMLQSGCFDSGYGFSVPSYFRCPLSLELMLDPVIVASGQTFERACIQKWIDHGLNICPSTGEPLSHTNFIPNYTIKAMMVTWFKENNHELPTKPEDALSPAAPIANHGSGEESPLGSHHSSNSSARLSTELRDACGCQETDDPFGFDKEESSVSQSREIKSACSPEHSYAHSRTPSASSVISSYDCPQAATEISQASDRIDSVPIYNMGSSTEMSESQNSNYPLTYSFQSSDIGSDETTTCSYVEKLVEDLKSQSVEAQTAAAFELRLLAKNNMENRAIIRKSGAIAPLNALLYSKVKVIQEHAVTALLNLSINEENKSVIATAGVVESLIHVLKSGNDAAKENAAAALFSLAVVEENKIKIGRSGAVKALVILLGTGSIRGKKDAVAALFNLSICHENKARIVQAGAVKHLVELLDQVSGLVDKAIALLSNLATVSEGQSAIVREGGIPMIIEILDWGSKRGKENAAFTLLQLSLHSEKFCAMVIEEGVVPPLVALSQTGTPRAREKAQQLLSHFRSQRETATSGKRKITKY